MLTKHFWKTYLTDYSRHIAMAIVGSVMIAVAWYSMNANPLAFMLGYILADPVWYYLISYKKQTVLDTNPMPLPYNIKRAKCNHEPLMEIDGKVIEGTKKCKNCGLNESYWE